METGIGEHVRTLEKIAGLAQESALPNIIINDNLNISDYTKCRRRAVTVASDCRAR